VSDRFDPETRPTEEQRSDGDVDVERSDETPSPPSVPEQPPPVTEEQFPPRYEPPAPTSAPPWPPPAAESTWPYRPEPEEPPPPPEKHGLNPLVRLGVPQPWRGIIDWVVTIVGAIAIVLAIKAWVVNPYRIPSSSMEPTLHCARNGSGCTARFSDRVLANRFIYHFRDPKRGEIVVFNVPKAAEEACGAGGVFVKRIIGLPGDVWQEREGFVYINSKKLKEPYIKKDRRDFNSWPARRIPKDNYFMMGDNRQSSCDSRRWGTVPRTNVIGKVFAIYWPPQRISRNLLIWGGIVIAIGFALFAAASLIGRGMHRRT
jgi:signal peptidase I